MVLLEIAFTVWIAWVGYRTWCEILSPTKERIENGQD